MSVTQIVKIRESDYTKLPAIVRDELNKFAQTTGPQLAPSGFSNCHYPSGTRYSKKSDRAFRESHLNSQAA